MYSSPHYTLYNPYRPRSKGYILKRYPHANPYRLLSIKELRDIKETILDPEDSTPQNFDSNFPSDFYFAYKFSTLEPVAFSNLVPSDLKTFTFSVPHSIPNGSHFIKYRAKNLIIGIKSLKHHIMSFYSFIFSNESTTTDIDITISITGIIPGDVCYVLDTLDKVLEHSVSEQASNPFMSPYNLDSQFILLSSDGSARLIARTRQTFRAFNTGGSIGLDFTRSSPQFPFISLPLRTFKFTPLT